MHVPRSKLSPPPMPAEHVQRGDEWLAQALLRRLTVVVAGPGFGKSTLLGGWAASVPSVWYTAGPADSEIARFSSGLAEALSVAAPGYEEEPEEVAAQLVQEVEATASADLLLVVDDAHELGDDSPSVQLLRALVHQAPPFLHLAVGSRTELPFSIERLRGQGQVLGVTAGQLHFSAEEVARLVATSLGDDASAALAPTIAQLTEGWPAAVRLAVESLRGVAPERRTSLLAHAGKPGGSLFAYLAEEVLRKEPAGVARLLEAVAPLEAFTYELCAHLGFPDAELTLDRLARRGLFLDAHGAEQGWLRLHALVRDAVSATLDEQEVAATRSRSAEWLESQAMLEEALRLWIQAGHVEAYVRLVRDRGVELIQRGAFTAIVEGTKLLPEGFADAAVETIVADACHCLGDDRAALGWFDRAEAHGGAPGFRFRRGLVYADRPQLALDWWKPESIRDSDDYASVTLLYAAIAEAEIGKLDLARAHAERAVALMPSSDEALIALATVAYYAGDVAEARALLEHAVQIESAVSRPHARLRLATIAVDEGRYQAALELADLATKRTIPMFEAWAALLRARCLHRLGKLDEALEHIEFAHRVYLRVAPRWQAVSFAFGAAIHVERGALAVARTAYASACDLADASGNVQLRALTLSGLARLHAFDDPASAASTAEEAVGLGPIHPHHAQALLSAGWVALAAGDAHRAEERARDAETEAHRRLDAGSLAEAVELRGAAARSVPLLGEALELWRRQGAVPDSTRVELAIARLEGAREMMHAAQARLLELGIQPDAAAGAAGPYAALAPGEDAPVAIRTLGGFRVLRHGEPVSSSEWQSRKARDVLKILVAARGHPVTREALMEALWPGEDPRPLGNRLNVLLATIRSILDPEKARPTDHFVAAEGGAVSLRLEHMQVDVEEFLQLAEAGTSAAAERLYSGDFLEEDAYEDWAIPLRDEARTIYVSLARALAREAAESGDSDRAVRYLQRILGRDPYDEDAHLMLVQALRGAGRHGEARQRYLTYTARMSEIGVEPAPAPQF